MEYAVKKRNATITLSIKRSKKSSLETDDGTLDGKKPPEHQVEQETINTPNPLQPKGINLQQADMFKYQLQKVATPSIGQKASPTFESLRIKTRKMNQLKQARNSVRIPLALVKRESPDIGESNYYNPRRKVLRTIERSEEILKGMEVSPSRATQPDVNTQTGSMMDMGTIDPTNESKETLNQRSKGAIEARRRIIHTASDQEVLKQNHGERKPYNKRTWIVRGGANSSSRSSEESSSTETKNNLENSTINTGPSEERL